MAKQDLLTLKSIYAKIDESINRANALDKIEHQILTARLQTVKNRLSKSQVALFNLEQQQLNTSSGAKNVTEEAKVIKDHLKEVKDTADNLKDDENQLKKVKKQVVDALAEQVLQENEAKENEPSEASEARVNP